jgi:hypothetical protein
MTTDNPITHHPSIIHHPSSTINIDHHQSPPDLQKPQMQYTTTSMKVTTSLILSAITISSFVDADAFVTPTGAFNSPITRQSQTPLTAASRHAGSAPLSKVALEMSGGGGGAAVSTEGTATIPDEIFNLVKSIVGAGVLSLPAGTC